VGGTVIVDAAAVMPAGSVPSVTVTLPDMFTSDGSTMKLKLLAG
jgi:hypothetical protein